MSTVERTKDTKLRKFSPYVFVCPMSFTANIQVSGYVKRGKGDSIRALLRETFGK